MFYEDVIDISTEKTKPYADAMYDLAEIYEDYNLNYSKSFEYLIRAADAGHSSAQHRLSVAYSTGIYNNLAPVDHGRSLLLEYFSALAGNPEAQMGMGYKYLQGISVPQSCEQALRYYEFAANHAARQIEERGWQFIYYTSVLLFELINYFY